jgi:hypothetical protein
MVSLVSSVPASSRKKKALHAQVRLHVQAGSAIYTDALESYSGLDEFQHGVVDHAVQYVDGKVRTNGLENFWALLKRGLHGTCVSVEPFHLFRYLDEQAYRCNRKDEAGEMLTDADRFHLAVRQIVGRRLTFDQLTGKLPRPRIARKRRRYEPQASPTGSSARRYAVGATRQRGTAVLSVPKEAVLKQEAKEARARARKRRPGKEPQGKK